MPFPEPLNPPWPVLPDGQCQWSVHRHLVTRCPGVPRGLGTQHGASDSDRCHGVSPAPSVSRCQDTDIVTISKNPFDSGAIWQHIKLWHHATSMFNLTSRSPAKSAQGIRKHYFGKTCIFRFDDVYKTQIVFMNVAEHRAIPKSFDFNFFQISKNLWPDLLSETSK